MSKKIPVGISGCLTGEEIRYNGGHKYDAYINRTLTDYFKLVSFCPEVGAGLGVPRPPIRLVKVAELVRAVHVDDPAIDVTDQLHSYSKSQGNRIEPLCGFILKKGSPSCGMERVKLYNEKGIPDQQATGIFASYLRQKFPNLPLEEEGRLGDARLRENFIQRVFVYWHWRELLKEGLTVVGLTGFHARLKLTLMSHQQNRARELGVLAASARDGNVNEVAEEYIGKVMQLLGKPASVSNHVNVLQHIQGYLKRELDKDDKAELVDVIRQYQQGDVPLIVPITLLKHHFRKTPDQYIENAWYMNPYPQQLRLRNRL